jgi:hypothetical protein
MQKRISYGLILFGILLLAYSVTAVDYGALAKGLQNRDYGELVWWIKRVMYAYFSLDYAKEDMGFILSNFSALILFNPDVYSKEVQDGLRFFLEIIQPLYILSISVTAFYLIFISGSPGGRSKAKTFMKDLIVGMIIISMSPLLLQGLVNLSADISGAILSQTDTTIVTRNLEITFGNAPDRSVQDFGIENVLSVPVGITEGYYTMGMDKIKSLTCTLCMMHLMVTFTEIELGYYTFLPFLLVIWGLGVYFFLRFAMITLFMIIFPLSVLLYSFETTKAVGRNMLEQTIMWIFLQVFSAVIVVSIALCIIQSQPGMLSIPGIPYAMALPISEALMWVLTYNLGFMQDVIVGTTGAAVLTGAGSVTFGGIVAYQLTNPLIEFIPFVGCFAIILAPLFIMRLFKGFLP